MFSVKTVLPAVLCISLVVAFQVAAARTGCPDLSGTWNFSSEAIEWFQLTAPTLTTSGSTLDPPMVVSKSGTWEFFQNSANNCLFTAKRQVTRSYHKPGTGQPRKLPYDDHFTGVIYGNGTRLVMRLLPCTGINPSARYDGEISFLRKTKRPVRISLVVDTNLSQSLSPPGALPGSSAGTVLLWK